MVIKLCKNYNTSFAQGQRGDVTHAYISSEHQPIHRGVCKVMMFRNKQETKSNLYALVILYIQDKDKD